MRCHEDKNTITDQNFIRFAKAPHMSDGVIIAKAKWKEQNTYSGICDANSCAGSLPTPRNHTLSNDPTTPPREEELKHIEYPTSNHKKVTSEAIT
jgi:hypothetical protein